MLFNSYQFFVFLLAVLVCTSLLRKYVIAQKAVLLLACYYFYAQWSPLYVVLILATTTVDFFVARKVHRGQKRRLMVLASLAINLGILSLFKYANFFIDTSNSLLRLFGGSGSLGFVSANILLPIGISFYTFKSISYVIDVYRGKLLPRRNFLDYALYVSFFSHLLAGPIVRATTFFPQLDARRRPTFSDTQEACGLILFGLVKKMVIADNLALLAAPVFDAPSGLGAWHTLRGVYAYTFQIYFDFSGYSDIAIGVSKLFGFNIPKNFDHPYVSTSFQEFWRRWHISLSTWLRDYLYISLGGSRFGRWHTLQAIMVTMLLGGLWHGASWNFVLWGALHGAYLVVERQLKLFWPRFWESKAPPVLFLRLLLVFNATALAWVFFRSASLANAGEIFRNLCGLFTSVPWDGVGNTGLLLGFFLLLHLVSHYAGWQDRLKGMRGSTVVFAYSVALFCLIALNSNTSMPFIYFRF